MDRRGYLIVAVSISALMIAALGIFAYYFIRFMGLAPYSFLAVTIILVPVDIYVIWKAANNRPGIRGS